MSDGVSAAIATLALLFSVVTWYVQRRYRTRTERQARVTVSFHWLTELATVVIPGRQPLQAGYHLVVANAGPAAARNVDLAVVDASGQRLVLLDLGPDELPLAVLDADGRYPIPWLYEPFVRHARRFTATISWDDDTGKRQERTVPLRRGQLPH